MRITLTITLALAGFTTATAFADAKTGQPIYEKSCKSCHGTDGTPNAGVAKMMKVEMRDFKSPEVQALSAADIKKIVLEGKGKMKPVKTIEGGAVDDVAAYVKSLKK